MWQGISLSAERSVEDAFMIKGIFSYEVFGQTAWITTTHVCLLIVVLALVAFAIAGGRAIKRGTEVPGKFQNMIEMIIETLDNMVRGTMGAKAKHFTNYISTIFLFILLSNISGLVGLRPPTADYGVTLPLGITTFVMVTVCKFRYKKVKGVVKELADPWVIWIPINLISDIAVPISLSLRLFANVLSGTIIMALVYGLLSAVAIAWPGALHLYFDLFSGAIQTYVFCMLTMTYLTSAMEPAE
jgi:F-type H+-transporting ATPase subunit a